MLERFAELKKKIFAPFVFKANPSYFTILAFAAACFAGYFFCQHFIIPAAVFVLLNGFFDALDGEIAKTYKLSSKFGDFLDHTTDRLADIAIFLGIIFGGYVSELIGFSTIIAILLVSYLGTQAQALTGKRLYSGLFGRSDRLIVIIIAGFAAIFYEPAIYYAVLLILILSVLTFFQRFYLVFQQLKKAS